MNVILAILFGTLVGFISFYVKSTGFGLLWNIYLGVLGSTVASCLMVYLYFMSIFSRQAILGVDLYSFVVQVIGAVVLIYSALFIKKLHFMIFLHPALLAQDYSIKK